MEKARNDLETSEILFDNGRFAQSVNRSYYAMFHAARALMAFERYDSKTHSGILSFFHQHYIKTGKIEINLGQSIARAEKIRIQSDYDDFFIVSRQQAQVQLDDAKQFLRRIEEFITDLAG